MKANKEIKRDADSTRIFDERTVEHDYRTLVPILRKGMNVLDVGCGTGAISKGIACYVGSEGHVTGIDNTDKFIINGKESYRDVENLDLIHADLFAFEPTEKFDLIVSARVLQWLSNPKEAISKMKSMLKPGGQISILDYNHEAIQWTPVPPESMRKFYRAFLKWRADAGMNNHIAEDLADYFGEAGLHQIEIFKADEVYKKGDTAKLGIWSKVANLTQIVDEGYITDQERLLAIQEYNHWVEHTAEGMVMVLKEVRGVNKI